MTCPTCGESTFQLYGEHQCPPRWAIWCPENGGTEEDATIIRAYRAARAVEEWAEDDDCSSADYTILGGSEAIVEVRRLDGEDNANENGRYSVTGEASAAMKCLHNMDVMAPAGLATGTVDFEVRRADRVDPATHRYRVTREVTTRYTVETLESNSLEGASE